jgi:hypothetical protein
MTSTTGPREFVICSNGACGIKFERPPEQPSLNLGRCTVCCHGEWLLVREVEVQFVARGDGGGVV